MTEKRVGLDIADVRSAIDAGDKLYWNPTEYMIADGLTKHLPKEENLLLVTTKGKYRIKWEASESKKQKALKAKEVVPETAPGPPDVVNAKKQRPPLVTEDPAKKTTTRCEESGEKTTTRCWKNGCPQEASGDETTIRCFVCVFRD